MRKRTMRRAPPAVPGRDILFIALMLLMGAVVREFVPAWIPYTVFVLMLCICLGIGAQAMHDQDYCPHHAFKYAGADGLVSRAEWGKYLCEGCNTSSYCLASDNPVTQHQSTFR